MGSAFGAAGTLDAKVEAVGSTNVTYSTTGTAPLNTNVAFLVSLKNTSTDTNNTINKIAYTVRAEATDGAEAVALDTAKAPLPSGCKATANVGEFTCNVSQLKAGVAITPYVVFWKAPVKVVNGVADADHTDFISTSITVYYAEQTDGAVGNNNSYFKNTFSNQVELGTSSTTIVKSVVSKLTGASLFTGVGAIADGSGCNTVAQTPCDLWTSTVVVPVGYTPDGSSATYTSAIIAETENAATLSSDLLTSNTTDLTIPGTSTVEPLKIILRRDSRTIARGAKIANAVIYYTNPSHPAAGIDYTADGLGFKVPSCTDAYYVNLYGPLPVLGIPCIPDVGGRKVYTKKDAQNLGNPEWELDWEFTLWAIDNGLYRN